MPAPPAEDRTPELKSFWTQFVYEQHYWTLVVWTSQSVSSVRFNFLCYLYKLMQTPQSWRSCVTRLFRPVSARYIGRWPEN